jgi:hypothetical protein
MKKAFKIIVCLLIVGGIAWIVTSNASQQSSAPNTQTDPASLLRFAWRFEAAPTSDDGMPRTQIFLDATYTNDKTISKEVGIVSGSCNEIDPSSTDTDMIPGSSKIQCYAAGLGYWFKIAQQDNMYVVLRKMFEEASPDHTPPSYTYERVTTLPLLY